jgi:intracellular multiplication protein IcmG
MADNDQLNDEYQFTDLDAISPEQVDENQVSTEGDVEIEKESKNYNATNVKRNALIVVVALIFAMLVYKLLTRYLTSKKHETIPAAVIAPQPKLLKPEVNSPPAAPVESIGSEVSRKISTLELGQEGMRSDVASFNTQLGGISNSVNALAGQVAELNQIISALSAKVAAQSQ